MKVKFVIPVVDTEAGNYEYHGRNFDMDEYFDMIRSRVDRTNRAMDAFAYNYSNGFGVQRGGYLNRGLYDIENVDRNKEIDYTLSESEALILDGDDNDVQIQDFYDLVAAGKKCLLKININPNSLDGDAESEIRKWLDESNKVLNDKMLDNKTMLLSLPLRDFIIDTATDDDESKPVFHIINCRVIQIYPKENGYSYYFAVMCGEIKKQ